MVKKQKTNILFFLGGALFDYNIDAIKTLIDRNPNYSVSAFICGRKILVDAVKSLDNTQYALSRYDYLNTMISSWIAHEPDYERLDFYRKKLGDDALRRLITSDREIGVGYVNGGTVEKTRLIAFFDKYPNRRWSYIIGLLDYCFDVIQDQKPKLIYTYGVAGADTLALHIVGDHFKIPCVQLTYARHEDFYILDPDTKMRMPMVKDLYQKTLTNKKLISKSSYEMAENYINSFINKPQKSLDTRFWIDKIRKEYSLLGFIKTLCRDIMQWGAISMGLYGSKNIWRQRLGFEMVKLSIKKFIGIQCLLYSKQQTLSDAIGNAKYLYFPLHVDPEMTTMVMADKTTDQLSVIEHISKQMPAGWKLIVKDHVPMIGKRPRSFYKRIKSMPDVFLISPFEDSFQCLQNSETVVTITGTSGWEAMMLRKVPVVLGYPHYINLEEGFVHCTELTKLGLAIDAAIKSKPIATDKLKLYTACMLKDSFELSTAYYWFKEKLPDTQVKNSVLNLVQRLESFIK